MKFTIGLPITKVRFLDETLKSIENQTLDDYEVVIRNNGSTENERKDIRNACSKFLEKSNAQYYENTEHLNISVNFNKILEKAQGKYLTILSDDDIIQPEFLEKFNHLIVKYPSVNIYHCRVKRINENNQLIDFTENCPEYESLPDFVYHRMVGNRTLYLSDFVYSTAKLKEINGFVVFPYGWGIDDITWCKLGMNGFGFTSSILLNYRVSSLNFTNQQSTVLRRINDLDFIKEEYEKIILSPTFITSSGYPVDFLIDKNKERIERMRNDIIVSFIKSSNWVQIVLLYFKSRNHKYIFFKSIKKRLVKKVFINL